MPKPTSTLPPKSLLRFARRDDDRACDSVAAVDGALRPFQHFDLLNVRQLLVERSRIRLQHTVHDEREVRLGIATSVHAANAQLQVADLGGLHLRQSGRQRDEIGRALDAGDLDVASGERLDRRGHVLDLLRALARGDDDLLQHTLIGRFLRMGVAQSQSRRHG